MCMPETRPDSHIEPQLTSDKDIFAQLQQAGIPSRLVTLEEELESKKSDVAGSKLPEVRDVWEVSDPDFANILKEMGVNVRLVAEE